MLITLIVDEKQGKKEMEMIDMVEDLQRAIDKGIMFF